MSVTNSKFSINKHCNTIVFKNNLNSFLTGKHTKKEKVSFFKEIIEYKKRFYKEYDYFLLEKTNLGHKTSLWFKKGNLKKKSILFTSLNTPSKGRVIYAQILIRYTIENGEEKYSTMEVSKKYSRQEKFIV